MRIEFLSFLICWDYTRPHSLSEMPPITGFCDVDSATVNPGPTPAVLGLKNTTSFSTPSPPPPREVCFAWVLRRTRPATASSSPTSSATIAFLILRQRRSQATYLLQGRSPTTNSFEVLDLCYNLRFELIDSRSALRGRKRCRSNSGSRFKIIFFVALVVVNPLDPRRHPSPLLPLCLSVVISFYSFS
ncbi:hypothetical protein glysoja_045171 [Glycine soja]|uniref:Uncharacterized protein n=1 Tax=Glycine soja TaxID=3848 RepID=A0A0B2QF85_GLYSO|nr:hypothetical protein glysoja_045171 [Glycine soja]